MGITIVVNHGSAFLKATTAHNTAVHVDGSSEEGNAVWIRGGHNRLIVVISYRKVAGERVHCRNVIAAVVAQAEGRIRHSPLVHLTFVPSIVILAPVIRSGDHALGSLSIVASLVGDVPRLEFRHILGWVVACRLL